MAASIQQMQQQAQEAADPLYSAAALPALLFSSALNLVMAAWGDWIDSRRVARRRGCVGTWCRRGYVVVLCRAAEPLGPQLKGSSRY